MEKDPKPDVVRVLAGADPDGSGRRPSVFDPCGLSAPKGGGIHPGENDASDGAPLFRSAGPHDPDHVFMQSPPG